MHVRTGAGPPVGCEQLVRARCPLAARIAVRLVRVKSQTQGARRRLLVTLVFDRPGDHRLPVRSRTVVVGGTEEIKQDLTYCT